jgi:hypothetical protein
MGLASKSSIASDSMEIASSVAPHHPQQPQVAVDAKGGIHIVYGMGDAVRYCRSTDGGKHFSAAIDLPPTYTISLGMRRGPRIAVTDKAICVSVIGGKEGKGRDGDVLAMRSLDGGKTWSEPVMVNDAANSAREGLHSMATGPGGEMACVWLDLRNKKTEVMAAISRNGGGTWSKNMLVYESPQGSVCECCHPSAAFDRRGQLSVLWRNSLDGARDMYVATSADGKTFDQPRKLGTGTWQLNACPMDGGAIAALPKDQLATVWRRDKSIYLSLAGDERERLLGPGEQPSIAATSQGAYIVWLTKRGSTLQLLKPGDRSPIALAEHASDPVIATAPGNKQPIVAVWESRRGNHHTIQFQSIAP